MNITFKRTSDISEQYCASWSDDKARYHVWIRGTRPEDRIYMNPLKRPDGTHTRRGDADHFETRKLDMNAAKNKLIRDTITIAIHFGALIEANKAWQVERDEIAAAQTAKLVADRRAQLQRIADATKTRELAMWLMVVSDNVIAELPSNCFHQY